MRTIASMMPHNPDSVGERPDCLKHCSHGFAQSVPERTSLRNALPSMSIETSLREEAEQAALSIQDRIADLEREVQEKSAERSKLIDELNHARLAFHRLEKYPVIQGSSILCPYCWVGRGKLSALARIQNDEGQEALRCNACLVELSLDPAPTPDSPF